VSSDETKPRENEQLGGDEGAGGGGQPASSGAYSDIARQLCPNEPELIARAQNGDHDALTELLHVFGGLVGERLKGKIGREWASSLEEHDVMQVTYLETFQLIDQFKPQGHGSFMAWLARVAENNLKDAIRGLSAAKRPNPRRRVQVSGTSTRDSFVALVDLLGTDHATPSRVAATDEAVQFIDAALGKLPPDYERVVRLYDLEGHSAAEVAAQLGRTPGAIYMLRARAHDRLKNQLGSESKFFSQG
jgi:RNA polymerase sigma factor (sigma-70 family)